LSIAETRDKDLLRRIFARDPIGAIYQIGDLDDAAFPHCRWFVDGTRGVLLIYTGLAVPMVALFGEVDALVREVPLPKRFYTKVPDRAVFEGWNLSAPDELYVMGLQELASFPSAIQIERVTDGAHIAALYQHYPGNYFDPAQVPSNVYLAARIDGNLVGAAGTHAWSAAEGAAAIGNVVTAAAHRGRGIARALMVRLCEELAARGCRHIGLHVNRGNRTAIACYERVGFRIHSAITQWTVLTA
jgi:ribosomal protein S18 acetylase RimI-like enzyme